MDPKEYLPFLESLSSLSESKRRVAIDTHLKRFDSAVTRLVLDGDFDSAIVIFPTLSSLPKPKLSSLAHIMTNALSHWPKAAEALPRL
jgi:hypothetical protein